MPTAVSTAATPRRHTVFHLCPRHQGIAASRERLAQIFGEGGPGSGGRCTPGDSCKVRPGTDLWVAEMCLQRDWYDTAAGDHHFRWAVNAVRPAYGEFLCTACTGEELPADDYDWTCIGCKTVIRASH